MKIALLHGFAGDPSVWSDVAFDGTAIPLPGHGGVGVQPTWSANLDALGVHEVVVGYSLGARVALGLLATGRAQRAILIGVNPGIVDDRDARRASDAVWARMLREQGIAAFADAWSAQPLFASQRRFPERVAARRAHRLRHDPEQLARSLEVMGLAEMPDYTDAIRDPRVSLIAGALDAKYIALAGDLPISIIPDSGHDPTLEQPEALARELHAQLVGDPLRPV